MTLNKLTKEQKSTLSEGNQALIQLGVLDNDLSVVNRRFITESLFSKFRKDVELSAIERVAELEAEAKEAK